MTAEAIAKVANDLRRGIQRPAMVQIDASADHLQLYCDEMVARVVSTGPIVDATAIYRMCKDASKPVRIYEDHPCIAPPWPTFTVAYVNDFGNVEMMSTRAFDGQNDNFAEYLDILGTGRTSIEAEFESGRQGTSNDLGLTSQPPEWQTPNEVEWDRVRWVTETFLWIGGRSTVGGPIPTSGPMHVWKFAIYEDGSPADLHWVQIRADMPMELWDMAHSVLLGSLNFLNCRNVDITVPPRPRAEQKRIERAGKGLEVSVINVFPVGKSSKSANKQSGEGVPLTPVRGHFAHYGACCPSHAPKGLLFGKHAGKFYIPMHARGTAELGERNPDYVLKPNEKEPK